MTAPGASDLSRLADARRTENLEEKGGPVAAYGSRAYHVRPPGPLAVAEQAQWLNQRRCGDCCGRRVRLSPLHLRLRLKPRRTGRSVASIRSPSPPAINSARSR